MATVAAKRRCNAAYEERARKKGSHHTSLRLSSRATQELGRLARVLGCARKDVVEGFLLGNINVEVVELMREHGLSESEAKAWIRMRQEQELPRYAIAGGAA